MHLYPVFCRTINLKIHILNNDSNGIFMDVDLSFVLSRYSMKLVGTYLILFNKFKLYLLKYNFIYTHIQLGRKTH